MSAIAGIITSSTDDLRFISAMMDLLAHRGPDGDGILWLKDDGSTRLERNSLPSTSPIPGRATLGHRQLNTSSSSTPQPLAINGGEYWISFDGVLYNAASLRNTLEELGHTFTDGSDAELAITAYIHYGRECFQYLDGPFALAILDLKNQQLILGRDPLGQRPLYYWTHRSRLAFASEIKALFAIPEIRPKLERQSITEYIRFGGLLGNNKTNFSHIQALPPGQMIVLAWNENVTVKPAPYTQAKSNAPLDQNSLPATLRKAFNHALEKQRHSTKDVGSCLTGGILSTAIATALRKQMGDDLIINSFSAIFQDPGLDERTWITAANGAAHTLSNWVLPEADDFMNELDMLLWYQDEPFAHPGVYAQWCVIRAAREAKTTILLDGLGAETYFGVQESPSFMQRFMSGRSDESRMLAKLLSNTGGTTGQAPALANALRTSDRNSMAFSIELRQPYLDRSVRELSEHVTSGMKDNQQFLRAALADYLPEPIGTRAHLPAFTVPLDAWMQSAILPAFLRDIRHARIPLVPIVHGGELRELVSRQMERPNPALNHLIFRLFIANRWMQRFNISPVI